MILHLYDAVMDGHKIAFIHTVDSDVVVLCICFYHTLNELGLKELWVGFGTGKHYKDIPIHEVYLDQKDPRLFYFFMHSLVAMSRQAS